MQSPLHLPELSYRGNERKKLTLHLFLQIVGKVRLQVMPRKNHWWYVTEYIGTQGISSGPMPYNEGLDKFEISFNCIRHTLEVRTSHGEYEYFELEDLTVADFYHRLMAALEKFGIAISIVDSPYDLGIDTAFTDITDYHHYDPEYSHDLWRTLIWVDDVFKEFSGRFYGKTCPVHLYWHSMDLAVTRFSGKKAAAMDASARVSDKDAYSHECISFGFWAGDENIPEPSFYSYTYPAPQGMDTEKLQPVDANWVEANGSPMAILGYGTLLKSEDPRGDLLRFLESAYQAGAKSAGWPLDEFKVPPLEKL